MIYEKSIPSWTVVVAATDTEMERFDDCNIPTFDEELDIMSGTIEIGPLLDKEWAEELESEILKEIKRGYEVC